MEDSRKAKEKLPSDSCYSENDLTSQLREKIRAQAQRLRTLEQYRLLCEQRIQELVPNHPIPLKPEHLGSGLSAISELQMAKQKISRLEAALSQRFHTASEDSPPKEDSDENYSKLLKDKTELEESLRAEMLNCEEQRSYIEVLKQALESKSDEFSGLEQQNSDSKSKFKSKSGLEESRREQAKVKSTIVDYESHIKRLQALVKTKETEIDDLKKERQELNAHLQHAAEALQIAEEEVEKLEEEKASLLEYVDEHSLKEQEMEKEMNELTKYFEEMKNNYDRTKAMLDQEKSCRNKIELRGEVHNEEVAKLNQLVKELQNSIGLLRSSAEDKDNLVKKLKEDRLSFEIKNESLQANASTLAETLKETQNELEELRAEIEVLQKQNCSKTETMQKLKLENNSLSLENSSFKESLADLQKDVELEKKTRAELERSREMDAKQIQDFKSKMLQLKAKCDSLEEEKKFRSEIEQYRVLDAQKLSQLQEEYNYLQKSYRETQQRELIQTEALNDLRKNNSEMTREIEELYKENQGLSVEVSKKSQDLEVYFAKCTQLSGICESFENDKKKLEIQLKNEKNLAQSVKDVSSQDKAKIEDLSRSLLETSENLDVTLRKTREKEEEIKFLKLQLKSKERDFEDEKFARAKLSAEFTEISDKLDCKEKDLDKIMEELVDCCKLIAGFSGKYSIPSNDFRSFVSGSYKDFLSSWKEKISSSPKTLSSWVSATIEEIENLAKQVQDFHKNLNFANTEVNKLSLKLDGLSSEEVFSKQEASKLKLQFESLHKKHEQYTEVTSKEINLLRLEINSLKNEIGMLVNENNTLKDNLHRSLSENHELRVGSEIAKSSLRTHEDRVNLLKTEKNQLENLLSQVQRSLGSSEVNKIYNEMSRIRGELELSERERLNFECQLLMYESDPRSKESDGFKEVSQRLLQCERQIRNYKKSLQMLQEDANKEEMVLRLRGSEKDTMKFREQFSVEKTANKHTWLRHENKKN